jgi:hypothetical protein
MYIPKKDEEVSDEATGAEIKRIAELAKRGMDAFIKQMLFELDKAINAQSAADAALIAAGSTPDPDEHMLIMISLLRNTFIGGGANALWTAAAAGNQIRGGAGVERSVERSLDKLMRAVAEGGASATDSAAADAADATATAAIDADFTVIDSLGQGSISFGGANMRDLAEHADEIGASITAAIKAAATGQRGPISVDSKHGRATLIPVGKETDLSKMN